MQKTVTALFDNAADAGKARQSLIDGGCPASAIDLIGDGRSLQDERKGGYFSGLKNDFAAEEDRDLYGRGIERGHVLLTVRADDDALDGVIARLDASDAIDIDDADWAAPAADATGSAAPRQAAPAPGMGALNMTSAGDEMHIPIGKRAVDKGGARVRTYVVETPVSEDVDVDVDRGGGATRPGERRRDVPPDGPPGR